MAFMLIKLFLKTPKIAFKILSKDEKEIRANGFECIIGLFYECLCIYRKLSFHLIVYLLIGIFTLKLILFLSMYFSDSLKMGNEQQ